MDCPGIMRQRLDAAIQYVVENKERYSSNPGVDFSRKRKLGMDDAIALLISMSGGTLQRELYKYAAAGGVDISPSAFCQSRAKISPKAFETVFRRFNMMCNDKKKYRRRYNLYAIDGSCINMARNPDSPCFVQNESNPRGYCQFHLNAWYNLESKTYFDAILQPQPRAEERSAALSMIERNSFHGHNILTLDRGYESYLIYAEILEKPNLDFVCRVRQDKSCMKAIQGWPMEEIDRDITVTLTTSQSREHKERGYIFIQTHKNKNRKYSPKTRNVKWTRPSPYTMTFRVVRFMLPSGEYETVATSLPRSLFGIDEIMSIYSKRWGIESSFRALKYVVNITNTHGRSDAFVAQEIYAALIAYNFASRIANGVVVEQKPGNVYVYQVNFTMAVFLCRNYLRSRREDGEILMQTIRRYTEPIREGRADKRKLRPKGFVGFVYRIAA